MRCEGGLTLLRALTSCCLCRRIGAKYLSLAVVDDVVLLGGRYFDAPAHQKPDATANVRSAACVDEFKRSVVRVF